MGSEIAITPQEVGEAKRLWAEYFEASSLAMEIGRTEGGNEQTLARIFGADKRAGRAITRIKEIYGDIQYRSAPRTE